MTFPSWLSQKSEESEFSVLSFSYFQIRTNKCHHRNCLYIYNPHLSYRLRRPKSIQLKFYCHQVGILYRSSLNLYVPTSDRTLLIQISTPYLRYPNLCQRGSTRHPTRHPLYALTPCPSATFSGSPVPPLRALPFSYPVVSGPSCLDFPPTT